MTQKAVASRRAGLLWGILLASALASLVTASELWGLTHRFGQQPDAFVESFFRELSAGRLAAAWSMLDIRMQELYCNDPALFAPDVQATLKQFRSVKPTLVNLVDDRYRVWRVDVRLACSPSCNEGRPAGLLRLIYAGWGADSGVFQVHRVWGRWRLLPMNSLQDVRVEPPPPCEPRTPLPGW